jgi:hypothetical protein
MTFTDKNLSEKLVKLGCKSQSFLFWFSKIGLEFRQGVTQEEVEKVGADMLPAFSLEDFVGPHKEAWKNGAILVPYWFSPDVACFETIESNVKNFKSYLASMTNKLRHILIDSPDWLTYLREAVERRVGA